MTMSAAVDEDYEDEDYEDEDYEDEDDEDEDDKDVFIRCIHEKRKVRLTFHAKEYGESTVRTCAPMDFGPSRQSKNGPWDRYHLWDYSPSRPSHVLSILPDQVEALRL